MSKVVKVFNLILSSLLIALINIYLIMPNGLINFGFVGVSEIVSLKTGCNPGIILIIINAFIICVSSIFLDIKRIKPYVPTAILIPVFMSIIYHFSRYVSIELPEMMLVILIAGLSCGLCYGVLYRQGNKTGTIFLIDEIISKLTTFNSKYYSWIVDIIILFVFSIFYGIEAAIYSVVVFIITKLMVTKSRFGISDSKMFYIITSKEDEVKKYIIDNLGYDLSCLDVKGGYSNSEKKIILTVINTNDFYKLKEGVKVIDKEAFITITDTYDVISKGSDLK